MDFQVISFVITVITGVVSVVLAVFAIWIGKSSERESRRNFERTQNAMREYNDKTKEVLAEIDKRAAVIEKTVTDSQQHCSIQSRISLEKQRFQRSQIWENRWRHSFSK